MKFAVFFLIAGLCLVAVNATAIHDYEIEPVEFDGQTLSIFTKFFWVLWKALRFLKGINCAIENVMHIRDATLQYPMDLFACNVVFTEPVKKVVDSLNEIGTMCDNIIKFNSKVCKRETPVDVENEEYQEIDGQTFSFFTCTYKLLKQFDALEHKLVATTKQIRALPDAAFQLGGCMVNQTTNLTSLFTSFPANVKACSKLKS